MLVCPGYRFQYSSSRQHFGCVRFGPMMALCVVRASAVVSFTRTFASLMLGSLPEGVRTSDSVFGGCVFAEKPKLRVSFVCAKAVISACAASGQSRVFSFYVLTVLLLFASTQGFRVSLVAKITDVFVLEA